MLVLGLMAENCCSVRPGQLPGEPWPSQLERLVAKPSLGPRRCSAAFYLANKWVSPKDPSSWGQTAAGRMGYLPGFLGAFVHVKGSANGSSKGSVGPASAALLVTTADLWAGILGCWDTEGGPGVTVSWIVKNMVLFHPHRFGDGSGCSVNT